MTDEILPQSSDDGQPPSGDRGEKTSGLSRVVVVVVVVVVGLVIVGALICAGIFIAYPDEDISGSATHASRNDPTANSENLGESGNNIDSTKVVKQEPQDIIIKAVGGDRFKLTGCLLHGDGGDLWVCEGLRFDQHQMKMKIQAPIKVRRSGDEIVTSLPINLSPSNFMPWAPGWSMEGVLSVSDRKIHVSNLLISKAGSPLSFGGCGLLISDSDVQMKCDRISEGSVLTGVDCLLTTGLIFSGTSPVWSGACHGVRVETQSDRDEPLKGNISIIGFSNGPTMTASRVKNIPLGTGVFAEADLRVENSQVALKSPVIFVPEWAREDSILNMPSEIKVQDFMLKGQGPLRTVDKVSVGYVLDPSRLGISIIEEFLAGTTTGFDVQSKMEISRSGRVESYLETEASLVVAGESLVSFSATMSQFEYVFSYAGPAVTIPVSGLFYLSVDRLEVGYEKTKNKARLVINGSISTIFKILKRLAALRKAKSVIIDTIDEYFSEMLGVSGVVEIDVDFSGKVLVSTVIVEGSPVCKFRVASNEIYIKVLDGVPGLPDNLREWSAKW